MINVLILDQNSIFRNGLKLMINRLPDCRVIGMVKDYEALKKAVVFDKAFIVLMRLSEVPENELAICANIKIFCPQIKVLLIARGANITLLVDAVAHGASGVYYEHFGFGKMHEALTLISEGGYFFDKGIQN
ncbi:MAG: hypothetical protein WDZ35_11260 [Crocinitomicaceae bacterium]